jgi:rubredoxin
MTDYFFCSVCDHMYNNSERDDEIQQPMCKPCANTEHEFYSSYGGN